jgi:hypothetical protein
MFNSPPNHWTVVYQYFSIEAREIFGYTFAMDKPIESHRPKKRGPIPQGNISTHVLLPEEIIEWAKLQPDRLSGVVREAMIRERQRRESASA